MIPPSSRETWPRPWLGPVGSGSDPVRPHTCPAGGQPEAAGPRHGSTTSQPASVQTHQISNISLCVGHISFVQLQAFHMFATCRTNCHEAVFWRVALVELDLRNWQPSGSLIRRAPRFGGDSLASVGADADLLFVLGCHWRRWGCDDLYGAPALGLLANVLQRLLIGLWACD